MASTKTGSRGAPGALWAVALAVLVALAVPGGAAGAARTAPLPIVGAPTYHEVAPGDTLLDLALRYNVGYTELRSANPGVDAWTPAPGTELVIPTVHLLPTTRRKGIVVNLADQRLYLFGRGGAVIRSMPIGVGSDGWGTPSGTTRIARKRVRPTWHVPKSIRAENPLLPAVVPPGPDNPLGAYALSLAWPAYVIHGTNKPYGVGRRVSHGCIRLYPADIAWLFHEVDVGVEVTVVDQPMKIAWVGDALMLEVHPSQTQADSVEAGQRVAAEDPAEYRHRVLDAAGDHAEGLDWTRVADAVRRRNGLPVMILTR